MRALLGRMESLSQALDGRLAVLALCEAARRLAASVGLPERERSALGLVIAELGTNAVRHGGGGRATVAVGPAGWAVSVTDDGPGFSEAVLADQGRSDHLGAGGVRGVDDVGGSFGSGLAGVRRLSDGLRLFNTTTGACAVALRNLDGFTFAHAPGDTA